MQLIVAFAVADAVSFAVTFAVAFVGDLAHAAGVRAATKQPRGAEVVERVLQVALEELGRVGLAALSLPRVAELAGINKTSLYRRWPTKQALVAAALQQQVPGARTVADHGDLESDLVDLAGAVAAFITSAAGLGVMRVVFADGDTPQAKRLAKKMWQTPARLTPRLIVERAIERGELRADADVELLLHTIGGAVLHRVFIERQAADAAWIRRLTRLLCVGVEAAATPKRAQRTAQGRAPR